MIGTQHADPDAISRRRPALQMDRQEVAERSGHRLARRWTERRLVLLSLCAAAGASVGGLISAGWWGALIAAASFTLGWCVAGFIAVEAHR